MEAMLATQQVDRNRILDSQKTDLRVEPEGEPIGIAAVSRVGQSVGMTFDEDLANRLRELVGRERGVTEQKMFGGLAFLINGNMAISASGQGGVLVRVDPAETERLVQRAHVARFAMRGREMDGWLRVAPEGVRTKRQLQSWATRGVTFARSLPPKR